MEQEPLHHWTHTGNTRHSHSGVHAGYCGRDLRSLAGRRAHRVGTATQGMGRTLGERTKKKKIERDFGSYKLFFFSLRFYRPSWVQLERLLRGPRPVTDRFPAPRSSTHTSSSIIPLHPPSPPSDCDSTHSVGTDTVTMG
jgi:hypothetical protein